MSSEPSSDKECNDDVSSSDPLVQTLVLNNLLETGQTLSIAMQRERTDGSHLSPNTDQSSECISEISHILSGAGLSLVAVDKS